MIKLKFRKIIKNLLYLLHWNILLYIIKFIFKKNWRIRFSWDMFYYILLKNQLVSLTKYNLICHETGHTRAILKSNLLNRLTFTHLSNNYKFCFFKTHIW